MGIFGKKRAGTLKPTDGSGHFFNWVIPKFDQVTAGSTLDSDNVTCYTKTKFHFHMSVGTKGDIGLYIHYKNPPIPKYSYYFINADGQVMRQHTAHTIPPETERCGHWNVCNYRDMVEFLGESKTLTVRFVFDIDTVTVRRVPEDNIISVMWTIPSLKEQNLNPYSSAGFYLDTTLLVMRLDSKRSTLDAIARWDYNDIQTLILFVFCRKGKIPPHTIELLDGEGNTYFKVEKKEDGTAQTMMVEREVIDKHLDASAALFVRVNFFSGGNPLEALNAIGAQPGTSSTPGSPVATPGARPSTVALGENKETYAVMDD